MKQCTKCGSWIEDDAAYCNVCGMQQEKICVSPMEHDKQQEFSGREKPQAAYGNPYGGDNAKMNSGLGIAGFVLGIVGFLFACCGGIGLIASVVGLILSIVAMVRFDPLIHKNRGILIAGLVLNGVALLFSLIIIPFWGVIWDSFMREFWYYY